MSGIAGLSWLIYKNGGSLPTPPKYVEKAAKKAVDTIKLTSGPSSPQKGSGFFNKIANCAKNLYKSMVDTAWMNNRLPAKTALELRQGQLCLQLKNNALPKVERLAIVKELQNIANALNKKTVL